MIPDSTITSKDDCWITRYWAGIQSGKYIVGALIKLQMQKLLELLQDDEVIKDFTDSNKRINFIQREGALRRKAFHFDYLAKGDY